MLDVLPHLIDSDFPSLRRQAPSTLQVNLGRLCNQQCLHCHVAAGPGRREVMDAGTLDLVIACLDRLAAQGRLSTSMVIPASSTGATTNGRILAANALPRQSFCWAQIQAAKNPRPRLKAAPLIE